MLARATIRAAAPRNVGVVARRGFQTTRAQLSSPYHYPEGPLTNIPFNPRKKGFALKYWTFCAVGFSLPFGIAGALYICIFSLSLYTLTQLLNFLEGRGKKNKIYIKIYTDDFSLGFLQSGRSTTPPSPKFGICGKEAG